MENENLHADDINTTAAIFLKIIISVWYEGLVVNITPWPRNSWIMSINMVYTYIWPIETASMILGTHFTREFRTFLNHLLVFLIKSKMINAFHHCYREGVGQYLQVTNLHWPNKSYRLWKCIWKCPDFDSLCCIYTFTKLFHLPLK